MPANPTGSATGEQRLDAADEARRRAHRIMEEADKAVAESRRTLELPRPKQDACAPGQRVQASGENDA